MLASAGLGCILLRVLSRLTARVVLSMPKYSDMSDGRDASIPSTPSSVE